MRSSDMIGGSDHDYEPQDQGDVIDHPAHNLPMNMQPRAPRGLQMAGDVIQVDAARMGGSHTMTSNAGGPLHDPSAPRYSVGADRQDNVIPIGNPTINRYLDNFSKRR